MQLGVGGDDGQAPPGRAVALSEDLGGRLQRRAHQVNRGQPGWRLLDPVHQRFPQQLRAGEQHLALVGEVPEEGSQTLRATVEWSVGLLTGAERSLLEITAAFTDGWTVEAAAMVAGLGEGRALELTEALARHSLIEHDSTQ